MVFETRLPTVILPRLSEIYPFNFVQLFLRLQDGEQPILRIAQGMDIRHRTVLGDRFIREEAKREPSYKQKYLSTINQPIPDLETD